MTSPWRRSRSPSLHAGADGRPSSQRDSASPTSGHSVVTDVTFRLRAGELTCLLGPNGAGKSTVIRMLLGLTTPSAGQCLVGGSPYRSLPGR